MLEFVTLSIGPRASLFMLEHTAQLTPHPLQPGTNSSKFCFVATKPDDTLGQPETLNIPVFGGTHGASAPAKGSEVDVGPEDLSELFSHLKSPTARPSLETLIAAVPSLAPKQRLNDMITDVLMNRLSRVLDSLAIQSKPTTRRSFRLRKVVQGRMTILITVSEGGIRWVLYTFDQKGRKS